MAGERPAATRPVGAVTPEGCRARHPSARSRGEHLVAPVARVGPALLGVVGEHPAVAAAVVAVRGEQGRSRSGFAAAYGLELGELAEIEAGRTSLAELPAPLRVLTAVVPLSVALDSATRGPGWSPAA